MVANAGDMAPEFEQHRQDHIKNDPLVIGYLGSIIVPFEDAVIASSGHNIAGEPQSLDQIVLSTGSVAATALGAAGSLDVPGTGMLDEVGEATDAGRMVAKVEGEVNLAVDSAMIGRRGGIAISPTVITRLNSEINGLTVLTDQDAFIKIGNAAMITVNADGTAVIRLRSGATRYELLHELQHFEHLQKIGAATYIAEAKTVAGNLRLEQFVYDRLRALHWKSLSSIEQSHADQYIKSLGGLVWP